MRRDGVAREERWRCQTKAEPKKGCFTRACQEALRLRICMFAPGIEACEWVKDVHKSNDEVMYFAFRHMLSNVLTCGKLCQWGITLLSPKSRMLL